MSKCRRRGHPSFEDAPSLSRNMQALQTEFKRSESLLPRRVGAAAAASATAAAAARNTRLYHAWLAALNIKVSGNGAGGGGFLTMAIWLFRWYSGGGRRGRDLVNCERVRCMTIGDIRVVGLSVGRFVEGGREGGGYSADRDAAASATERRSSKRGKSTGDILHDRLTRSAGGSGG